MKKFTTQNILILISVLAIILFLVLKISLIFSPFIDFDESGLGLMAKAILDGKIPYHDFFDHKPPFAYYSLAIFFKLFGISSQNILVMAFIFDIALILSIFFLIRKLYDSKTALIAAAICSILISTSHFNTDIPMALFGVLGISCYLFSFKQNKNLFLFLSGVFIAISLWFKQPGIMFFFAIVVHQLYLYYKKDISFKDSLKSSSIVLLGLLGISLPLFAYFMIKTSGGFFYDIIIFNVLFKGSTSRLFTMGKLLELIFLNFGYLLAIILFSFPELKAKDEKTSFYLISSILIFLFFAANKEIFSAHLNLALPIVILLVSSSLFHVEKLRKPIMIIIIIFILSLSLLSLESAARTRLSGISNKQVQISSYLTSIPENATIFSDSPEYYFLGNKKVLYKVPGLAPSYKSVFDFSDFCDFANKTDFLIFTHRIAYLPESQRACINQSFTLIKRFDNVAESYVEIYAKNPVKNNSTKSP